MCDLQPENTENSKNHNCLFSISSHLRPRFPIIKHEIFTRDKPSQDIQCKYSFSSLISKFWITLDNIFVSLVI